VTPALSAVALTLAVYAALGISSVGWGAATARLLRLTQPNAIALTWLGWATTVLILQLLHCATPLNAFAAVPVFLAGIAFAAMRGLPKRALLSLALIPIAAWIASRSMLVPAVYDAGLYHLNTIRWINTFPIVPGLGNLHGRLAFNQSYFTWAAALNAVPHGSRMANGFLFLLTIATLVARLRPVAARPALLWESHPLDILPSLFALPILGHLALTSPGLASPTPDLPSELLQLVLFVTFAAILRRWLAGEEASIDDVALLAILGATAITIKLSNLAFAAIVLAVAVGVARRFSRRLLLFVIAMLVVWMGRGYVTSGAPLYPSTLGAIAFDWAVPRAEVAQMATLIRGWARQPNPHWRSVYDHGAWIEGWLGRIRSETVTVTGPLALGVCFLVLALGVGLFRKTRLKEWLLLVPVIGGLVYWFLTAPDPRFAHALFFCFAIACALIFLAAAQRLASPRTFAIILCAVFALTYRGLARQAIRERATLAQISVDGWQPLPTTRLIARTTTNGLVILTPAKGDQCWDAPLPCTPYFRVDLRERVPGKLASGFTVTRR
jgi:hypothetical protein